MTKSIRRCEECEYYDKSNCSKVMPSGNSACVGFVRRKTACDTEDCKIGAEIFLEQEVEESGKLR